jgi:hypothetical protein
VLNQTGSSCRISSFRLPALGRWRVTATVLTPVAHANAEQQIRDLVVLALGDSLTSGEGNPDRDRTDQSPVVWKDRQCDRSADSWAARLARSLENSSTSVTFLDFACSGADTNDIAVGPYRGEDPQPGDVALPAQTVAAEQALGSLTAATTRAADIVLMSAGPNNLGFGDLLNYCARYYDCVGGPPAKRIPDRIDALPASYDWLAAALTFHVRTLGVHVLEYPTRVFTNNFDQPDGCGAFTRLSNSEAEWIIDRGDEMNAALKNSAAAHGWRYVGGVRDAFRGHGYCAGDERTWFRSYSGSNKLQGNENGTAHPNRDGHAAIVETVDQDVRPGPSPPLGTRVTVQLLRVRASQQNIEDVHLNPSPLLIPHFYFTVTGFRNLTLPSDPRRAFPLGTWVTPGSEGTFYATTAAEEIKFNGSITLPGVRIEDPNAPKGFRVTPYRTMTFKRVISRDNGWGVPPPDPRQTPGITFGPIQHVVLRANLGGTLEVDYKIGVGAPITQTG